MSIPCPGILDVRGQLHAHQHPVVGVRVHVLQVFRDARELVEPALFEALLEELSDQDLHRTVLSRMGERSRAIEVDIDAI